MFPSNSEDQLVSVLLKRALQCSPVIAQHTLAYSWGKALLWSLVRHNCVFYKLEKVSESLQHAEAACFIWLPDHFINAFS